MSQRLKADLRNSIAFSDVNYDWKFENYPQNEQALMVQSLNLGKSRKNAQWETRSTFSFKNQTQMISNKRK